MNITSPSTISSSELAIFFSSVPLHVNKWQIKNRTTNKCTINTLFTNLDSIYWSRTGFILFKIPYQQNVDHIEHYVSNLTSIWTYWRLKKKLLTVLWAISKQYRKNIRTIWAFISENLKMKKWHLKIWIRNTANDIDISWCAHLWHINWNIFLNEVNSYWMTKEVEQLNMDT